jgi:hypothetical protein
MVVNFKTNRINRGAYKLIRTPILIEEKRKEEETSTGVLYFCSYLSTFQFIN